MTLILPGLNNNSSVTSTIGFQQFGTVWSNGIFEERLKDECASPTPINIAQMNMSVEGYSALNQCSFLKTHQSRSFWEPRNIRALLGTSQIPEQYIPEVSGMST